MLKKLAFGGLSFALLVTPLFASAQTTSCYRFPDQAINRGSRGDVVIALKQALKIVLGNQYREPINEAANYYGSETARNVEEIQDQNDLERVDGVGPRVRAILNARCSNNQPTPSNTTVASTHGTVSITSGSGSFSAAGPIIRTVAGGSTGVTMGILRLRAAGEPLRLETFALQLTSGRPSSVESVYLYNGPIQVGTGLFVGESRTAVITLFPQVLLQSGVSLSLTIKADFAQVGPGQPGVEGDIISIDWDGDNRTGTRVVGQTSGETFYAIGQDTAFPGVRLSGNVTSVPTPTTPSAFSGEPTNITAIAGDRQAVFSFGPPTNTNGNTITGYRISCSVPPSGIGYVEVTGRTSPITVTGLINGYRYACTIRTMYSSGRDGGGFNQNFVTPTTGTPTPATPSAVNLRAYPTVSLYPMPAGAVIQSGQLMRFWVATNAAGHVGINRFTFNIAMSPGLRIGGLGLYAYTDSNYSTPVSGQGAGGLIGSTVDVSNSGTAMSDSGPIAVVASTPIEIPAGQIYYFMLRGSVAGVVTSSNQSITTTLLGDATYDGMRPASSVAGNFVWSPNTLTTSSVETSDWTNSAGIPSLPPHGLAQTITGLGTPATPTPTATSTAPTVDTFSVSETTPAPGSKALTFTWTTSNNATGVDFIVDCANGIIMTSGLSGTPFTCGVTNRYGTNGSAGYSIEPIKFMNTTIAPIVITASVRAVGSSGYNPASKTIQYTIPPATPTTPTTGTAPIIEFIGIPTLSLQYDSAGKESALQAVATVKVTAGNTPVDVNNLPYILQFYRNGYGVAEANSLRFSLSDWSAIPANTSRTLTITNRAPTSQLFAGSYSLSLSGFNYRDSTVPNGDYQTVQPSSFVNVNELSNGVLDNVRPVTIIGETSPYITSISPTSRPDEYLITGRCFDPVLNIVTVTDADNTQDIRGKVFPSSGFAACGDRTAGTKIFVNVAGIGFTRNPSRFIVQILNPPVGAEGDSNMFRYNIGTSTPPNPSALPVPIVRLSPTAGLLTAPFNADWGVAGIRNYMVSVTISGNTTEYSVATTSWSGTPADLGATEAGPILVTARACDSTGQCGGKSDPAIYTVSGSAGTATSTPPTLPTPTVRFSPLSGGPSNAPFTATWGVAGIRNYMVSVTISGNTTEYSVATTSWSGTPEDLGATAGIPISVSARACNETGQCGRKSEPAIYWTVRGSTGSGGGTATSTPSTMPAPNLYFTRSPSESAPHIDRGPANEEFTAHWYSAGATSYKVIVNGNTYDVTQSSWTGTPAALGITEGPMTVTARACNDRGCDMDRSSGATYVVTGSTVGGGSTGTTPSTLPAPAVSFSPLSSGPIDAPFTATWGVEGVNYSITVTLLDSNRSLVSKTDYYVSQPSWTGTPAALGATAGGSITVSVRACRSQSDCDNSSLSTNAYSVSGSGGGGGGSTGTAPSTLPTPTVRFNPPSGGSISTPFTASWEVAGAASYMVYVTIFRSNSTDPVNTTEYSVTTGSWTGTPADLGATTGGTIKVSARACNATGQCGSYSQTETYDVSGSTGGGGSTGTAPSTLPTPTVRFSPTAGGPSNSPFTASWGVPGAESYMVSVTISGNTTEYSVTTGSWTGTPADLGAAAGIPIKVTARACSSAGQCGRESEPAIYWTVSGSTGSGGTTGPSQSVPASPAVSFSQAGGSVNAEFTANWFSPGAAYYNVYVNGSPYEMVAPSWTGTPATLGITSGTISVRAEACNIERRCSGTSPAAIYNVSGTATGGGGSTGTATPTLPKPTVRFSPRTYGSVNERFQAAWDVPGAESYKVFVSVPGSTTGTAPSTEYFMTTGSWTGTPADLGFIVAGFTAAGGPITVSAIACNADATVCGVQSDPAIYTVSGSAAMNSLNRASQTASVAEVAKNLASVLAALQKFLDELRGVGAR